MVASLMKSMFLNAKNFLSCSSSQTSLLRLANSHPFLPKTKLTAPLIYHNLETMNMNNTRRCWFHFQQLVKCCKSRYWLSRIALFATICSVRFERVPFSDRHTVVLAWPKFSWIPSCMRDKYVDIFCLRRACNEGGDENQILPPTDPKTIRVTEMVGKIVQTMHSTLELQKDSLVRAYTHPTPVDIPTQYRIRSSTPRHRLTSLFDSRRRHGTKHLEGREWKVAVIDSPNLKVVRLLPNCTIFIRSGYLDSVSEEALAHAIGHEIGHYIARHYWENILVLAFTFLVVMPITTMVDLMGLGPPPPPQRKQLENIIWSNHRQRQELEADYIGMMLMASAGYNPQVAPEFPLAYFQDDKKNYSSTHPSPIQRSESLQQSKKMKQAMDAFKKAKTNE